jgi:hypothetical protein
MSSAVYISVFSALISMSYVSDDMIYFAHLTRMEARPCLWKVERMPSPCCESLATCNGL